MLCSAFVSGLETIRPEALEDVTGSAKLLESTGYQ
jgi:hypothetical protein